MKFLGALLLATGAFAGAVAPPFPVALLYSENDYKGNIQPVPSNDCIKLDEHLVWQVNSVLLSDDAYCLTYYDDKCDDVAHGYQQSVSETDPDVVVAVSCHKF